MTDIREGDGISGPGTGLLRGPVSGRMLGVAAGLILFALVLITCIDVVGRYFLDTPLTGAFELTEVLLAALVFLALPLTTERGEHVEVDLVNMLLKPRIQQFLVLFAGLFSAAVLATFSWRLGIQAIKAAGDGTMTNALSVPLAPLAWLACLSCAISAVIAVIRAFQPRQSDEGGDPS
ncbi:MAG: TRAP transporter small permease [Pseudorhodobacter sp.]